MSEPVPLDAHPPWDTTLKGTRTELPTRADVVVVGASLAGLAAAGVLAHADTDVVVLEANSPTGDGADRRGHGQAFPGLVEHPWRLEQGLGFEQTRSLVTLTTLSAQLAAPDGPVPAEAPVYWAATESEREPLEIARSAAVLEQAGVDAEVLDTQALARRTGTRGLGDAMRLSPAALDAGMALHTRLAQGLGVVSPAPVQSVDEHGDGVTVTLEDGRVIACEVVLLANGYDARSLHPFLDDTLSAVREIAVRRPGPPGPAVSMRLGFGWTTLVRDGRGDVTLSGCRWASAHLETGEIDPTRAHPAVLDRLIATGDRFVGGLGQPTARWGWIEAHGCDNLPLVGPLPSSRRVLLLTGFGNLPLGLGLGAGHLLAHGLLEGTAPGIPACLDPARFVG